MLTRWIASVTLLTFGLSACGEKTADGGGTTVATGDSLVPIADAPSLDTSMPPPPPPETVYVARPPAAKSAAPRPAPAPPPQAAATTTAAMAPPPAPPPTARAPQLTTGTTLSATAMDSIHSQVTKVGDPIRVRVTQDVSDADGKVVIPAGSIITLAVVEIAQAPNRDEKGKLALSARSILIDGTSYPITARATDYAYEMKARGVGTTEVAKTGAGAVAGGIIGRVIGGKTGTVVGAVGGAAAGAAVAAKSANRDIIVHAGGAITITLRDTFERP